MKKNPTPEANAINISGLLVQESRLLNPKNLGNFKKELGENFNMELSVN